MSTLNARRKINKSADAYFGALLGRQPADPFSLLTLCFQEQLLDKNLGEAEKFHLQM